MLLYSFSFVFLRVENPNAFDNLTCSVLNFIGSE